MEEFPSTAPQRSPSPGKRIPEWEFLPSPTTDPLQLPLIKPLSINQSGFVSTQIHPVLAQPGGRTPSEQM